VDGIMHHHDHQTQQLWQLCRAVILDNSCRFWQPRNSPYQQAVPSLLVLLFTVLLLLLLLFLMLGCP
jgi:hypothetical protein